MNKLFSFLNTLAEIYHSPKTLTPDNTRVSKKTFIYKKVGDEVLHMDKYDLSILKVEKPCIIFVFGGGFKEGQRDDKLIVNYMQELAKRGYVSIAIDYRLGLKNVENNEGMTPEKFAGIMQDSVSMAVEDLFDATRYVYEHAKVWNINKNMIIANGSSAGAITVLNAEYMICNKSELTKRLPDNFNYAGVITFAGAVFNHTEELKWNTRPAPILLFHGDADSQVPYNKLVMENYGFFGSKHIAEQLEEMKSPYYFYTVENAAHEIAGMPMKYNLEEIRSFINRFIINKQRLHIVTKMEKIGRKVMEKNFNMMDCLQANFLSLKLK